MIKRMPPTVLVVGVAELRHRTADLDVYTADSIRETVATIRLLTIDLLVAGLENPTVDVWELIGRVQTAWPQQRWILLSSRVTADEEIVARSLGALLVMHEFPHEGWLTEFASSLRRRESYPAFVTAAPPLEAGCLTAPPSLLRL